MVPPCLLVTWAFLLVTLLLVLTLGRLPSGQVDRVLRVCRVKGLELSVSLGLLVVGLLARRLGALLVGACLLGVRWSIIGLEVRLRGLDLLPGSTALDFSDGVGLGRSPSLGSAVCL